MQSGRRLNGFGPWPRLDLTHTAYGSGLSRSRRTAGPGRNICVRLRPGPRPRQRTRWRGVRQCAGHIREGVRLRVVNNTDRYLRGVRIEITLESPAAALDWADPHDVRSVSHFPGAPADWGTETFSRRLVRPYIPASDFRPARTHGVLRIASGSPAAVAMEMDDLRPQETFLSDDDEVVLVILADQVDGHPIRGTWRMTAEDVHEVFSGEFEVPVQVNDWRKPLTGIYGQKDSDEGNTGRDIDG